MCTAISMHSKEHYFGRNLDLSYHYHESVTITPRKFPFSFRNGQKTDMHYAMIGIATVMDNYPLYYDAVNEYGLGIAALNFPGNAVYNPPCDDQTNVTSYELIPWLLSQCVSVRAVREVMPYINITNQAFSRRFAPTPLHWLIADGNESVVLESTDKGISMYNNPIHVLTNNPPFPYHMHNLENYINVTAAAPTNRFSDTLRIIPNSYGMGGIGLPGDLSSSSRFVRAAFHLHNSVSRDSESAQVNRFFHVLQSVSQTEGCVCADGEPEKTVYSSCCNTGEGIYYYKTYDNSQITAVHMHHVDLDSADLVSYPLKMDARYVNEN